MLLFGVVLPALAYVFTSLLVNFFKPLLVERAPWQAEVHARDVAASQLSVARSLTLGLCALLNLAPALLALGWRLALVFLRVSPLASVATEAEGFPLAEVVASWATVVAMQGAAMYLLTGEEERGARTAGLAGLVALLFMHEGSALWLLGILAAGDMLRFPDFGAHTLQRYLNLVHAGEMLATLVLFSWVVLRGEIDPVTCGLCWYLYIVHTEPRWALHLRIPSTLLIAGGTSPIYLALADAPPAPPPGEGAKAASVDPTQTEAQSPASPQTPPCAPAEASTARTPPAEAGGSAPRSPGSGE